MPKKDQEIKQIREWGVYAQATAELAGKKTFKFAGLEFTPDSHKIFIVTEVCHSLPLTNSRDRCFTAKTLANSYESFAYQLADFEHRLKFYGHEKDAICGACVAVEPISKKDAVKRAEKGEAVPVKILAAVWRKAERVEKFIADLADDPDLWKTSMECGHWMNESALYDGEKFIPYKEWTDEMAAAIEVGRVKEVGGKKLYLAMGGEDGTVEFGGFGFTKYPADRKAKITDAVADSNPSIEIVAGWRSREDWIEAAASIVPPAQESSALVIGSTAPDEGDGHAHEITANLDILPAAGHSHWFKPVAFDPESGVLEGYTNNVYRRAGENTYLEHAHKVRLARSSSETAGGGTPQAEPEVFQVDKHLQWLREQAKALEKSNPEMAKLFESQAKALEGEIAQQGVEETIAARIKSGDLIPKADHAGALEAAAKKGREDALKELAEREAEAKRQSESIDARLKAIADAGLDKGFVLRKTGDGSEVTLEAVARGIPTDEKGCADFADRLAEWQGIAERTGQMKLAPAKQEKADDGKAKPKAPPFGGDPSGKPKIRGAAYI